MREIKFRVWNKAENEFSDISEYGSWYWFDRCIDPKIPETLTIQQYTGLKDKNGIEIYEGDIVKATSDQYKNENFVGKVIFDEGCFLTWINKNDIRGIWGEDDIEVIGNIFETPELLKS